MTYCIYLYCTTLLSITTMCYYLITNNFAFILKGFVLVLSKNIIVRILGYNLNK